MGRKGEVKIANGKLALGRIEVNRLRLRTWLPFFGASQMALVVKNPSANAGDKEMRVGSLIKKIPWIRKWHLIPIFLPGKSHGQRSLAGCSP